MLLKGLVVMGISTWAGMGATVTVRLSNYSDPATLENTRLLVNNAGFAMARVPFSVGTHTGDYSGFWSDEAYREFIPIVSGYTSGILFDELVSFESPEDGVAVHVVFGLPVAETDFWPGEFSMFRSSVIFGDTDEEVDLNLANLEHIYGIEAAVDTSSLESSLRHLENGFAVSVPEPSSVFLLGLGIGVGVVRRLR